MRPHHAATARAWAKPNDINGLQTLCRSCHIEKTRVENRRELTPAEAAWRKLVAEIASQLLSLPFIPSIAETLEFCITTGYPFRHA